MEEIIERYGDDVFRLCLLYLGNRQLAEDAFQTTMLKTWQQMDSFRSDSSLKTWMMHIAANTCRDVLRSGWFRMWKKSQPEDALFDIAAPQAEDHSEVRSAVLALPGIYREAVVLHYYKGMSIREMAQCLHLPVSSVSTRLRRARMLLGKTLKGGWEE